MPKAKYKCFKCNKIGTLDVGTMAIKKDIDAIVIFKCKFCNVKFKTDYYDYMDKRDSGKTVTVKTFSARKKIMSEAQRLDMHSEDKRGFIDKWWWAILIVVFVFAFYDDLIQGRIF